MGQLRTTNKRHKRAITKVRAKKAVASAPAVGKKNAKADR